MANIIDAIYNLVTDPCFDLNRVGESKNRINSVGDALEHYVKDMFAGTVRANNLTRRNKWSEVFSYTGNTSNPPDAMLRNGDAIEIKKIETDRAQLALNSSYPHQKLYSTSEMISEACRNAEEWSEKDMIYCVGTVKKNQLTNLVMVYGLDYCASEGTYTKIRNNVRNGIAEIPCVELAQTNELARLNRVDPLGITYLRVRGMWGIEHPERAFDYIYEKHGKKFNFMCIINEEKYYSFYNREIIEKLLGKVEGFEIKDVEIKNPDNPVQYRKANYI